MLLSEILKPGLVKCNLESVEKDELFEEMVQMIVHEGVIDRKDKNLALSALQEREEKMSTGISDGIALPHGKASCVDNVALAIGISKSGIEYDSLDGEPVNLVFMLLCNPGRPALHVSLLSEISRLLTISGFKEQLLGAATAEEVIQIIKKEE